MNPRLIAQRTLATWAGVLLAGAIMLVSIRGATMLPAALPGAVAIVIACLRRISDQGRPPFVLVWTAVPLVEAVVVPSLPIGGVVPLAVTAILVVWGVAGTARLMRARPSDIEALEIVHDKTIRRGMDGE